MGRERENGNVNMARMGVLEGSESGDIWEGRVIVGRERLWGRTGKWEYGDKKTDRKGKWE